MLRGACHCTAIRFELEHAPEWVLDCNCTLCRRYGALWIYPDAAEVRFISGAEGTDVYVWGDRDLEFHRCRQCGCIVHMTSVHRGRLYGINARLIPTLDPASVRVRQKDNGHTGFFWTRSDAPPEPSHHPKMAPPEPEDWR